MKKIDYSSEAISRRLRQTEQLRVLSLSLIKAKKIHDEKIAKEKVKIVKDDRLPVATVKQMPNPEGK